MGKSSYDTLSHYQPPSQESCIDRPSAYVCRHQFAVRFEAINYLRVYGFKKMPNEEDSVLWDVRFL